MTEPEQIQILRDALVDAMASLPTGENIDLLEHLADVLLKTSPVNAHLHDMLEQMSANIHRDVKVVCSECSAPWVDGHDCRTPIKEGWMWMCSNCDQIVYGKTCCLCRDTIVVPGGGGGT